MAEGVLLIISGPSGVGKGTVCRHLLTIREGLKLSLSTTTRPPRPGEEEGREYNFATTAQFKKLIEEDVFLEWAEVHDHHYGTRLDKVKETLAGGDDLILEIDTQGAEQVRKKIPGSVSVFMAPPSLEVLRERIRGRGTEDSMRISRRLKVAVEEMNAYSYYDYIVINDKVDKAALLITSIIDAEKCRVSRGAKPPGWGGEANDLSFDR